MEVKNPIFWVKVIVLVLLCLTFYGLKPLRQFTNYLLWNAVLENPQDFLLWFKPAMVLNRCCVTLF
ncbi:hypothetical protein Q764_13910 [Flavobacterium suncheonense GH29-5 = DSM 17707]|uniref:Uncharacterized protein n=1 Tax=Flavobacterium suncheonense GH29-5 = DSM 17707 TaxID=1121899 RepID=A0A0A2M0Q3_9FLAO|nr:hypothetical protein Q764_13910 [Flavobacterium suncheonense GH29-5 = DSM 17707]